MGTRTPYVNLYKPSDSEVVDQQLNDNADYDLLDAAVLSEHNLTLAHTGAAAPHTGHAVIVGTNVFQGQEQVVAGSDALALLIDTGVLVAPGVLTGSRHTLRAHSYDSADHRRDFILRARATTNAGAGVLEILTSLDGTTPTLLWSVTSAGALGSAPSPELFYANSLSTPNTSIDLTTLPNVMFVFPQANGITITLPDARVATRPIYVHGPPTGQITVAAVFGTVNGGSANLTTGAIQNGVIVAGDSFTYKADGLNWYD